MYRLIFTSRAAIGIKTVELVMPRNAYESKDITGITLVAGDQMIQVLEGPREHVGALFSDIRNDGRYTSLNVITQGECEAREFSVGTMRVKKVNGAEELDEFHALACMTETPLEIAA